MSDPEEPFDWLEADRRARQGLINAVIAGVAAWVGIILLIVWIWSD